MANTKAGGEKVRQTMIEKYGSEEAYKQEMRRRASVAGRAKVPKGYSANRKLASESGKRGGSLGRRSADTSQEAINKMKELRLEGLTLREIASITGVSTSTVNTYVKDL